MSSAHRECGLLPRQNLLLENYAPDWELSRSRGRQLRWPTVNQ
jgi:hypothetical protein